MHGRFNQFGKEGRYKAKSNGTQKIFRKKEIRIMKGKKLLAGVLSAAMVLGTMALPVFADGENWADSANIGWYTDSASEYTLSSAEELAGLASLVNSGTSFAKKTIKLGNDIDLNGIEWTPIGKTNSSFQGTFDGNGNTVKNLLITGSTKSDVGLFGFTTNGEIKNFTLENAQVSGYLDVGAVAGTPYTSKYTDITVKGSIKIDGFAYVGGAFGKNAYANLTNVDVIGDNGSYVTANSGSYRTYVGGLVGFMGEGNQVISDCDVAVDVTGSTCDIGGISGNLHYGNKMINCTYRGSLALTNPTDTTDMTEIGGLVGTYLTNSGSVTSIEGCSAGIESVMLTDLGGTTRDIKDEITATGAAWSGQGNAGEHNVTATINGREEKFTNNVANIGNVKYFSLESAIAAAQDGDTVTLVNDVMESIKIDEGKAITFDLNGKTLTNTDGKHTIENHGELVVKDGSQNKTGKVDNITNGRISFVNYEGGVATLNGGSFDRSMENGKVGATDDGCNSCYTIKNWGIMTINENVSVNNNTDRQGGSSAIGNGYQNGANFDKHTNVTSANVKLTINGGKFTGGLNTIKNDDWAILEVHGGVFKNNTQQCIMNWNKATITGGIFTGEPNAIYNGYDNDSMDKGILEITGGEFNGKIQVYDVNKKGKTSISGGTFNTDVSNYCAPGFSPKLVNGKYVVDDSADTLKLTFKKHADDERVYDIVLNGDGKDINRLNTVHFTFDLDNPNMTYAIKTAKGMSTIYPDNNEYVFYYDGKDGFGDTDRPDTAQNITIGTVTFDGFGKFTFKATAGKATATTTADNLVTEFVTTGEAGKGTLKIGDAENMIKDAEIKVPTQKLTVNVAMEHNVGDNTEAYQDMTVAISGGDLAGKVLEYKLGDAENTAITKAMNGTMVASYQIKADLTKDRIYTVTVSGAGYRTSRYTVTMTEDKTMNFWNNDKTNEVTVIDDEKAKTTFLAGELVRDGKIDIYDLSAVVAYFGQKNIDKTQASKFAKYDLNRDGEIDIMDISIVLTSWGK